jgi:ribonuclease HII
MKIDETEKQRLVELCYLENQARKEGYSIIIGVDEAGRGPLAGPVVAAACYIPSEIFFPGIDDSKKLTSDEREALFEHLVSHSDIDYGIGIVEVKRIDEINILQATFEAMKQAIVKLKTKPHLALIDGSQLPNLDIPCRGIVKGDSKSQSIAAASILAKVTRDRIMLEYHNLWPHYFFNKHKGYATEEHFLALETYGPSPIHRKSFEPIKEISSPSLFSPIKESSNV